MYKTRPYLFAWLSIAAAAAAIAVGAGRTPAATAQEGPVVAAPPRPPAPQSYPERTALWEKAIAAYETRDKEKGAPAPDGILFAGSSSIGKWTSLAADFPGLPVYRRGFGGSQIQDSTYYAGRIITPYRPRAIVFYAGDNDLADGFTTEMVVGDFQRFVKKARTALPDTKILFLAIKPSPSRWKNQARIVEANRAIQQWMGTQKNLVYVDVHTPMLGADGQPRPELYLADRLHMTPAGYRLWTRILAPLLK